MVITTASYEALRQRAKSVKPQEQLKPTRFWIAVLFEDRDPSDVAEQIDFLWVKGNGKTTIEAIHDAYHERKPGDFSLQLGPTPTKGTDRMTELNKYDDKLIVLLPVRPSARASSSPKQNSTVSANSPPPMIKPEPSQVNLHNVPSAMPENKLQMPSERISLPSRGIYASNGNPSQRPFQEPGTLNVPSTTARELQNPQQANTASWTYPSQPTASRPTPSQPAHPQPSSIPAHPGTSGTAPVFSPQQTQHSSSYANDPRIMNAINSVQSSQYPWLHHHVTQTLDRTPSSSVQGNGNMSDRPLQAGIGLVDTGRPGFSALTKFTPPATSLDRFNLEEQRVSPAPSKNIKAEPQNPFLQQLSSETNPEKLEKGVEKAMDLLKKLQTSLEEDSGNKDAGQWLQSIEELKKDAIRSRTVIGVVGNTGAGKSSVINALLEEECLVPTNCMRACTAVVTELSYNESEDEQSRYQADIEFIKPEDWHRELETLFSDLLDGSGKICKEASNPDSEAGVAFAKIRAVYPNKTKEQFADGGLEPLMRDSAVNKLLGTTKHITDADSLKFHEKLQTYVDSQEKATGRPKKDEIRRMEYWPLIKVVKIYTKAKALSTGAVLVDLPGVHDSNAARAAVADGYMKQCTGLWIVAPITRAVDDKAAKTLLGDSFKRQLKLDGTYNNVTFICSKTDDISIREAVQSLNLYEVAEKSWQESDEIRNRIKDLKEKISECTDAKDVFVGIIDDCDEQMDVWEKLGDDLADGKTVYAPSDKKRKRPSATSHSQKRRRTEDADDDFIENSSEAGGSEPEDEDSGGLQNRYPLSSEEVETKKQEIRAQKKNAKGERSKLDQQAKDLRKELKDLNQKLAAIDHEISSLCIKGRNDYSRGAIQQDFAAGIKELDQEAALEEDEENFDPDKELRDYDEVARSLTVFCISSRAFQGLSGRLKRDKAVPGFKDAYETEMPQLQDHCKKLTEAVRATSSRKFLNNLSQLLNSLTLWASNGTSGSQLTVGQQQREVQFLEQKLVELHKGLSKVVDDTLAGITDGVTENIYDKYDRAIKNASDASIPTSEKWGKQRNEGGLYFATYRATVVRNGAFSGAAGPHDFNGELAEPMIKQLTTGWERTFQRILPGQLDGFKTKAFEVLRKFHDTVIGRAHNFGASIAAITTLSRQLSNYEPFLEVQVQTIKEMMTDFQREVNREFTPTIAAAMEHAYELCSAERGPGSYKRMKDHMASHISANRDKMFQAACDAVRVRLDQLSQRIKAELASRALGIHDIVRKDYLSILGNIGTVGVSESQAGTDLKCVVASILESGEQVFRRLVEGAEEHSAEKNVQAEHTVEPEDDKTEPRTSPTAHSSETEKRGHESHWETDNTLLGSGSDEKENSTPGKVISQTNSGALIAEDAALQSLDTNI